MAQDDRETTPDTKRESRTGASTWPVGGSRASWAGVWGARGPWPQFLVPARLRKWAALEAGAGRLLPWFAVAYGAGIVLYFTAEREPAAWAALVLTAFAVAIAFAACRSRLGFPGDEGAIAFTSLIAGLATTPYAVYNFYRLAPYGVLANLLAMPVVSAWIMPMGIPGVLTLPLGFDGVSWRLMGEGIEWIIAVVLWVTNLPGAVGRIHAFGVGPLLLNSVGLLLLCLLRSPLRTDRRQCPA